MSKAGEIPYAWSEIEDQIRAAIMCQASVLERYGPGDANARLVGEYLGLPTEEFAEKLVEDVDPTTVAIERHGIFRLADAAYRYAYQLGGDFGSLEENWYETEGLLHSWPEADADGERSPFCRIHDFPLRRMLETFLARYSLFRSDLSFDGQDLTIRQLSLLANMTIPAVRTSLSKEGFKLERAPGRGQPGQDQDSFRLPYADCLAWLSRRRGFIPQLAPTSDAERDHTVAKIMANSALSLPARLEEVLRVLELDAGALAAQAGIAPDWFKALVSGLSADPDVVALRALARYLSCPEPEVAAAGVYHLVSIASTL